MSELVDSSRADPEGAGELPDLLSAVASHLDDAATAAERAAAAIRGEAEANESVPGYLARDSGSGAGERTQMVSELTETVAARVEEIASRYGQLSGILEASAEQLAAGEDGPGAAAAGSPRTTPGPGVARVSDGLRLIATRLAVAGSSREEIEQRLRGEFGVKDSTAVVDELFGRDFGRPDA